MTIGAGGSTCEKELERLRSLRVSVDPIADTEFRQRINIACGLMRSHDLDAIYVCAGSNLYYFTGTQWHLSERMAGALLTAGGSVHYIAPHFEKPTFEQHTIVDGEIHGWHEHESPFQLFVDILKSQSLNGGRIGIDESMPYHHFAEIASVAEAYGFVDARPVTAGCRMRKSSEELRMIQAAMNVTLEVHKSAAGILRKGISTTEVTDFIDAGHKAIGSPAGSTFCAVQFGEATAYPHGVPYPQTLDDNDMVLIDTGCRVHSYHSDITRTYAFGTAADKQRKIWSAEKAAQAVAFDTAQIGVRCGDVDIAVRQYLEGQGFGPDYAVPGLPHRTGHGLGLDIHEWPYLVRSDDTLLAEGMCFSNEPMLCLYGEFGVRLEDHFYMTPDGPRWFTNPSHSIDDPFALDAQL